MPEMVFRNVTFQVSDLVGSIDLGAIGLPDIQRPFVWEAAKVRDLFDSMYKGFPVGHLLFWESGAEPGAKQIGTGTKQTVPNMLIVDGQQRLTSLYAVMKRRPVIGSDYAPRDLRIAFRPRDETFAVADAAIAKDPAFMQDIGEIWARPAFTVITDFLARLEEAGGLDGEDEKARIAGALNRLDTLTSYPFTALVLGAEIDEERVADVFVRINSKGKNLNQADFILTLMSVHWDEGRRELEQWSRDARVPGDPAWNRYLSPDPDGLLRVAIALGFRRGRLEDAYSVLRGRDPKTGRVSSEVRESQFATLAQAQRKVLDKSVWKEFLQSILRSGHRSNATISSENAMLYAYAFYLIGRHDYGVPLKILRDVIARWFFMTSLTGRYSASPETRVAADLASLPVSRDATAFVARLDEMIDQQLTNDYWEITLPGALATSASRSPTLFGYIAALCVLKAPVLFSKMLCAELLDPELAGGKSKLQRHHLFPKHFLEQRGIVDTRDVNQIANLAILEWHDNLAISAKDPAEYWPAYLDALRNPPPGMEPFSEQEIAAMIEFHALPNGWPTMDYTEFLEARRRRMADVVRRAFFLLSAGDSEDPGSVWPPSDAAVEHLLLQGETNRVELKSSLRADLAGRGVPPKVLEHVVARTVAGFMNNGGGVLVIGADDAGTPLGLQADLQTLGRKDLDGFQQALVQVLDNYLGGDLAAGVKIHLGKVGPERRDIAVVECPSQGRPVYVRNGASTEFHVRAGNTTRLLDVEESHRYIRDHWKGQG
jgi:hypothetical protein